MRAVLAAQAEELSATGRASPLSPPAFRPRTEATRERDVFKYLHPWIELYRPSTLDRPAFPVDINQPIPDPQPCTDVALNALTQLGALRFNARFCIITLVTSSREFVLSESSRSLKRDKWIGTCSFTRDESITGLVIGGWRKARNPRERLDDEDFYYTDGHSAHWCIVSDLKQHPEYSERMFTKRGAGKHRFYFSVPLRDIHGVVLGSLTVIDDKPRYGVSAEEMTAMEDLADSISEHLDASLIRAQRQRSEKLIRALGLFNSGKDSLREWWIGQDNIRLQQDRKHTTSSFDSKDQQNRADEEFGQQQDPGAQDRTLQAMHLNGNIHESAATVGNSLAGNDRDQMRVDGRDFNQSPEQMSPEPRLEPSSEKSRPGRTEAFNLASETERTYSRASNLLREALHADGVAFMDASSISTREKGNKSSDSSGATATSTNDDTAHTPSDPETSDSSSASNAATKVNGISLRRGVDHLDSKGEDSKLSHIPQRFLAHLIKRYPQGQVFNFEENGGVYTSSGEGTSATSSEDSAARKSKPSTRTQRDALGLRKYVTDAKTIAFYPVWDNVNGRYRSSTICWSTRSFRFFDSVEDITYLASFAHSLIAEISRLETVAADRAKSSFISSISHELRSPLHGVLAGVEFLQETELSSFQTEMANTISLAGRTLLDTVNHILDFSKISNFTRAQRRDRAAADASRHHSKIVGNGNEMGVTFRVDLGRLTEELVETVVSSSRFESTKASNPAISSDYEPSNGAMTKSTYKMSGTNPVSVIVNIAWQEDWTVSISPGSWTRVVTNIVSNALKYTNSGTISVKLEVENSATLVDEDDDEDIKRVRLIVEDTGIGISEQFLNHDLYTPFKQEDSHSAGTGLGLSIVNQIVKDMGADLKITSKVGQGTRVVLELDTKFIHATTSKPQLIRDPLIKAAREMKFDRIHVLDIDRGNEDIDCPPAYSSVLAWGKEWLNCKTSVGPRLEPSSKLTIFVIPENLWVRMVEENPQQTAAELSNLAAAQTLVFILAGSSGTTSSTVSLEDCPITPIYIYQPIGPRKLLRAITYGENSTAVDGSTPAKNRSIQSDTENVAEPPDRKRSIHWLDGISTPPSKVVRQDRSDSERTEGVFTPRTPHDLPKRPRVAMGSNGHQTPMNENAPLPSPSLLSLSAAEDRSEYPLPPQRDPNDPVRTILLVEDNVINMKLLVMLMRKLNLTYYCAENGLEALNTYTADPSAYSLIMMDMSMPVMDGFEATSKIREFEHKRQLRPCMIIALTGVTSAESRQRALGSGVDKYYTKPIRMKQLGELVEEIRGAEKNKGE